MMKGLKTQATSHLLEGLGSKKQHSTLAVKHLSSRGARHVKDCLVSAAFLSYAGALRFDYRVEMI